MSDREWLAIIFITDVHTDDVDDSVTPMSTDYFPRYSKAVLRTERDGVVTEETVTVLADNGGQSIYVACKYNNANVWRSRLTRVTS
jgi:hypothetical protein